MDSLTTMTTKTMLSLKYSYIAMQENDLTLAVYRRLYLFHLLTHLNSVVFHSTLLYL